MSDKIKSKRLEGTKLVVETPDGTHTYDSKFLVAAMLIYIARGSGTIAPEESSKMIDLLGQHFALQGAESLELLRLAIREMCRVCSPGGAVCLTTPNKLWYLAMRASQKMGLRDYAGIENWLYPGQAVSVMRSEGMTDITISGCHLWPFQIRFLRPALKRVDALGKWLYPVMINFGILCRKPS